MTYNRNAKNAELSLPHRQRLIDMPNYEYKCKYCDIKTETKERYDFGPECPVCGRNMLRVWHAPGVHFKGTGFYKTDNP
jgi:putative FmdB family regulatory protein